MGEPSLRYTKVSLFCGILASISSIFQAVTKGTSTATAKAIDTDRYAL